MPAARAGPKLAPPATQFRLVRSGAGELGPGTQVAAIPPLPRPYARWSSGSWVCWSSDDRGPKRVPGGAWMPLLGGDQDDPLPGPCSVNCAGGGALEDLDVFDVVRIHVDQIVGREDGPRVQPLLHGVVVVGAVVDRNPVDHEEWLTLATLLSYRGETADLDVCRGAGIARGRNHRDVRRLGG